MSKKSKRKKIKKKFKELLRQKLAEQENKSQIERKPDSKPEKQILITPNKTSENKTNQKNSPQTLTEILNPYVKPDLIRIGIYLSIFIVMLVAASIINEKTTLLSSLASRIFSLLHLG